MLLPLAFSAGATAAPDLSAIQAQIEQGEVLRGGFVQSKTLAGFSKPLQSNGHFVIAREQGVIWHIDSPLAQTLIVTRDAITASSGDVVTQKMSAADDPAIRTVNRLLFAALSGDFASLNQIFKAEPSGSIGHWRINLVSRDPGLSRIIGAVELSGDEFVRSVTLHEANGDLTQISLIDESIDQHGLSAAESHALKP